MLYHDRCYAKVCRTRRERARVISCGGGQLQLSFRHRVYKQYNFLAVQAN